MKPVVMRKAMTPDELRPSYVDPASVPGLLDGPSSRNPSPPPRLPAPLRQGAAAGPHAARAIHQEQRQHEMQQRKKGQHDHDMRQKQIQMHERRHQQGPGKGNPGSHDAGRAGPEHAMRGAHRRQDNRDRSVAPSVERHKAGAVDRERRKVHGHAPSSMQQGGAEREDHRGQVQRDRGGGVRHARQSMDGESSEIESDYTSSNSDDDGDDRGGGYHTPRHKTNRLRTVAEEPDKFSDDDDDDISSIFDESGMPMKGSGIVEPEISFSEIERREEAAVAARAAAAAAAVVGGTAGGGVALAPTDAILSPGAGRRFMGAMLELKAGPSQQQLERQHALRNQLKEDLEAQIEEKRIKDQKYRDEQRARDEKEEAEARAYQERLDKLRAASPDTRARQKAKEKNEMDVPPEVPPAQFQIKEESIVGFSGRPAKSKTNPKPAGDDHLIRGGGGGGGAEEGIGENISSFAHYGDNDQAHAAGVLVANGSAAGPRASFGHTAIRRDVAELKMQQQELVEQVQQLAQVASSASAQSSDRASIEKLKQELREQQARAEEESERIRTQAKAEVHRIQTEAEARLAKEAAVRRSLQGASVFVDVESGEDVFLVSEQLVPKDTNYIPTLDELKEIRIDVDDLPAQRPVQSVSAASPSPDSALLQELEHEKRASGGHDENANNQQNQGALGAISGVVHSQSPVKLPVKPSRLPQPPLQQKQQLINKSRLTQQQRRGGDEKAFGRPGEKLQRTKTKTSAAAAAGGGGGGGGAVSRTRRRQWAS